MAVFNTLLLQPASATQGALGTKSSHRASAPRHPASFGFGHPPSLRRFEKILRGPHGLGFLAKFASPALSASLFFCKTLPFGFLRLTLSHA